MIDPSTIRVGCIVHARDGRRLHVKQIALGNVKSAEIYAEGGQYIGHELTPLAMVCEFALSVETREVLK